MIAQIKAITLGVIAGIFCLCLTGTYVFAETPPGCPGTEAFEKIKSLEGEWTGTVTREGHTEKAAVRYQVMSGGSAVLETLFPDELHRRMSTYYDEGGKLSLTHYGPAGNRSTMILKSFTDEKMEFELVSGSELEAEPHYHSLTIEFLKDGNLRTTWNFYAENLFKESTTLNLSRLRGMSSQ